MRALAITGIETASTIPATMSGSLIRATPPCARMSAGTRSSAMTATAPASSAIFACSGVTTSMITPPLSISARPDLTLKVPVSIGSQNSPLPLRRRARTAPVLPGLGAALLEQPHVEEVIQLLPAVALRGGDELLGRHVRVLVLGVPVPQDLEEGGVADLLAQRLERQRAAVVDRGAEQVRRARQRIRRREPEVLAP